MVRVPASGRKHRPHAPDIIAIKKNRILFVEVKYRGKLRDIHIPINEWEYFIKLEDQTGGEVWLAVYYKPAKKLRFIRIHDYDDYSENYVRFSSRSILLKGKSLP